MRLEIDERAVSVRCSLRRPSVWLAAALLLAVFGTVALGYLIRGDSSAARGFLVVGLILALSATALAYGLWRDAEASLLDFVRRTATDAARETEVPDEADESA